MGNDQLSISAGSVRMPNWHAWRRYVLWLPMGGAGLVLLGASLFPIRLDRRNFQDLARVADLELPRGKPYLFVSRQVDDHSYRFVGYVLPGLSWPAPERLWLTLGDASAAPRFGLALDREGRLWAAPSAGRTSAEDISRLAPFLESGVVLYETDEVRREAGRRLVDLTSVPLTHVIGPPNQPSFVVRMPANELTLERFWRLSCLLGLPFALYACLGILLSAGPVSSRLLAASLATWSAPAIWMWLLSWAQVTPWRAPGVWPFLAWAGCAGLLAALVRGRPITAEGVSQGHDRWPIRAATVLVLCHVGLAILRLDFDEDAHSHWLLMARSYHALGRHVPESVAGHIHSATYPFGYPSLLGLSTWAADMPSEHFLGIGLSSSLALLLYRLGTATLHLSCLGLMVAYLRLSAPGRSLYLAGPVVLLLLFSVLQGQHMGAETILLPLFGGVMVALALARRMRHSGIWMLALFVGGVGTLLKLEATLLLCAVILPWAVWGFRSTVTPSTGWRGVGLLALGMLPTVLWRTTLDVSNPVYAWPSVTSVMARLPDVPMIYLRCTTLLIKAGLLLLLTVLPALAALYTRRVRDDTPSSIWLVPGSVWACLLGLPLLYVFSNLPTAHQIDTSFLRLVALPTFSAALFCFEALLTGGEPLRDKAA